MIQPNDEFLTAQIKQHEGFSRYVYEDSEGIPTIGYGRNLESVGVSDAEAEFMLDNDIRSALAEAGRFYWFAGLSETRQRVITEMVYNLGRTRFCTFVNMAIAIADGDYDSAAVEMLDSTWAGQVKGRAILLAEQMRAG